MKPANLLLAHSSGSLRDNIVGVLEQERGSNPLGVQDARDWPNVVETLRQEQPEVLMLELGPVLARLGDALREVRSCTPHTKVVALHPSADTESILAALRSGVHEFVHPPWQDTLWPALERVISLDSAPGDRQGKIIGFLSAKGGCGATTIACHVAADLRRQTKSKVLLVDLDLASGMVGFAMKVQTSYSVIDAVQNLSRLDESLWKALIVEAKPGLDIVPAPSTISSDSYIAKDDLCQLIRFMRMHHDWVVLDLGRSLNRFAADIYEDLDQLFLVSVLEVTALHGLKTIVRRLTDRGENLEKLQLILNRTPKMMDMSTEDLAKILGRPLYAMLPNDYPSLYRAYSNGTLLPPEDRLAKQFSALTSKMIGVSAAQPKNKKKFRLFA
ncbi:MAG TPA: AAA family ATPase [Bryobacteraceae bacterium]|jgi:pilus assembly protein CpaE|nr:AAA family ATPase [Bryobacteraceae bacterium]